MTTWTGHDFASRQAADLAALLAAVPAVGPEMVKGRIGWLKSWLEDPQVLTFLRVNTHEGHVYLHRESLEFLLTALTLEALFEAGASPLVSVMDARALVLDLARTSGYRLDIMKAHFVENS